MKIAILTTQTVHHACFVREIAGRYDDVWVGCETEPLSAPFETAHPFELERDRYEKAAWFSGGEARLEEFATCTQVPVIAGSDLDEESDATGRDITLVFGTRKLTKSFIEARKGPLLNLHGGEPEAYRGLDTHLWAIYHRDFGALSTCLHCVDGGFDTGAIVGIAPVPLESDMQIYQLRKANTEVCIKLCLDALRTFAATGRIASRPQRTVGRYYSFMPTVLKNECVARFSAYTAVLR